MLCTVCDAREPLLTLVTDDDLPERTCVTDWLDGQQLSDGSHAIDQCFHTDPFPPGSYPNKLPKNRRFFFYTAIAKKLGGVRGGKNRAKLPECVLKRIEELYPDTTGAKTKVGFKRARDE